LPCDGPVRGYVLAQNYEDDFLRSSGVRGVRGVQEFEEFRSSGVQEFKEFKEFKEFEEFEEFEEFRSSESAAYPVNGPGDLKMPLESSWLPQT
jgi:hypothetical protein